jgi:hypothetical protein
MRLALAPKAVEVEEAEVVEAGEDMDEVEEAEVVGGVLGRRALDIKTRTLVLASKNL